MADGRAGPPTPIASLEPRLAAGEALRPAWAEPEPLDEEALEPERLTAEPEPRAIAVRAGVVLAAGAGVRLARESKPSTRVAGATLLERSVRALRQAGIERIVVVTGHRRDLIERLVAERGLDVELVHNPDFVSGNATSVLAGGRVAGGRFLLVMADHVFGPEAVERLLAADGPFVAAVDTQPSECDLSEATKVRLLDGRVVALGRKLEPFDAVDAGLFVCDPSVLQVAARTVAAGGRSWNAVKRRWLAEGGSISAVDLRGLPWIDVDTPADVRRAERMLVRAAAGKPGDGVVSSRLNRPLSWRISLLLLRAGVTPMGATLLSFALALAAAGALALGAAWPAALVLGGALVQLASIVDGTDGEIARATLRASPRGAYLDSVLDRVADAAVLVGLAVACGLSPANTAALLAALAGSLLVSYTRAAYERAYGAPLPATAWVRWTGRDVRLLLLAASAVLLRPEWGLYAVAALTTVEVARRTVAAPEPAPGR